MRSTTWISADAVQTGETEKAFCLRFAVSPRLKKLSGVEAWVPKVAVRRGHGGWLIAEWWVEKVGRPQVDTKSMRPRAAQASPEYLILILFLAVSLIWYAALEITCRGRENTSSRDYTAAVVAAFPHSQE